MKVIRLTEGDLKSIVQKILIHESLINESDDKELRIIEIQKALRKLEYNLGRTGPNKDGVDGKYGELTKRAIEDFQTKNGIKPTGFVGEITAPKLGVKPMIKGTRLIGKGDKKKENSSEKKKSNVILSKNANLDLLKGFKIDSLSTTDSIPICKAGQEECAQFVNDYSKKITAVGSAWLAHDIDDVGTRVMSPYTSLNPKQVEKVLSIFKKIVGQGGPQKRVTGGQTENIKLLQQEFLKNVSIPDLKIDDVVGIFYPPSSYHETAFYEAGKNYFTKDKNGQIQPKPDLKDGKGFGMNTHLGIVGAIKDGVPLIFNNVKGQVYSDPPNNLHGGGKIIWVKRK